MNYVTEASESLLLSGEQWNQVHNLKENNLAKLAFWWCRYLWQLVIRVNLALLTSTLQF